MKKVIVCLLLSTSFFLHAAAQPGPRENGKGKERIKALYIAYITQELGLTENEAQKFWPLQEQFSSEIKAVNKDRSASELDREESALNVKKKYNEKFSKIIGNERTNQFFRKDKEFRGKLMENLKEKRTGKHEKGGPGKDDNQ